MDHGPDYQASNLQQNRRRMNRSLRSEFAPQPVRSPGATFYANRNMFHTAAAAESDLEGPGDDPDLCAGWVSEEVFKILVCFVPRKPRTVYSWASPPAYGRQTRMASGPAAGSTIHRGSNCCDQGRAECSGGFPAEAVEAASGPSDFPRNGGIGCGPGRSQGGCRHGPGGGRRFRVHGPGQLGVLASRVRRTKGRARRWWKMARET